MGIQMRDKTLDHLRGLAMLWVIWVHVLYWGGIYNYYPLSILKSWCLFEMPLFFFITGASNSLTRKNNENYFLYVLRKWERVLIPYWIFAAICAFLTIVNLHRTESLGMKAVIKIFILWMLPIDHQYTTIPYLTWAIWFIPVYLCVIVIFPMLRRIHTSQYRKIGFILLILLFLFASYLQKGFMMKVSFYSLWTYAGLYYPEFLGLKLNSTQARTFILINIGDIALLAALKFWGMSFDMQANKFPPNIMFACYSVVAISTVLYVFSVVSKHIHYKNCFVCKLFSLYCEKSMTVFLYQVFPFLLCLSIWEKMNVAKTFGTDILKMIFLIICVVPMCGIFARIFGNIEKIKFVKKDCQNK